MCRSRHHEAEAPRQAAQQEGDGGIPDTKWSAWLPLPFGGCLAVSWLHAEQQTVAEGSGMGSSQYIWDTPWHPRTTFPRRVSGQCFHSLWEKTQSERGQQWFAEQVPSGKAGWAPAPPSPLLPAQMRALAGMEAQPSASPPQPDPPNLSLHRVDLWRASARPGERLVPQLHD